MEKDESELPSKVLRREIGQEEGEKLSQASSKGERKDARIDVPMKIPKLTRVATNQFRLIIPSYANSFKLQSWEEDLRFSMTTLF